MSRRTTAALEDGAIAALTETLTPLGVVANVLSRESWKDGLSVDAVVELAGQRFAVVIKSVVTAEHGARLASNVRRGTPRIVVADRIAADAKQSLREAGVNYFDRRGELCIVSPPMIIHTIVESTLPIAGGPGGSLDSQVSKEVAICCLLEPDQPHGVRQVARYIGPSPQRRLQRNGSTARGRSSHLRWRSDDSGPLPCSAHVVAAEIRCACGAPRHQRKRGAAARTRARRARVLDGLGPHRHSRRRVLGHADRRPRRPSARFLRALGVSAPRRPLATRRCS